MTAAAATAAVEAQFQRLAVAGVQFSESSNSSALQIVRVRRSVGGRGTPGPRRRRRVLLLVADKHSTVCRAVRS